MYQLIVSLLVMVFITGGVYLFWVQKYSRFGDLVNKIPGPTGYTCIGTILNYYPTTQEHIFNVNSRDVKRYGVIYKEWFFDRAVVFITNPDDVELILSSVVHLSKSIFYNLLHIWLSSGLLTSDGAKWQKRRKILTPAFHFTILQEFVSIFNKETEKLVGRLKQLADVNPCIDVQEPVSLFTLSSIAETSMGTELGSSSQKCNEYREAIFRFARGTIYRLTKPWLYIDMLFLQTSVGKATYKAVQVLHNFSRQVIAERMKKFYLSRQKPKKKLIMLDLLLQNNDIDDEGIAEEVDTFMFEGHDTTATALGFILLCLANHPNIQQQVYEEMETVLDGELNPPTFLDLKKLCLMERFIKESLRLFPSVPYISRRVSEDVKTSTGYVIPRGAAANIYIFHLHRNPNFFPNPEKFDPDRFLPENSEGRHPFCYLPFSGGPRNCIGQRYALLELKAALCGILKEFVLDPVDRLEDLVFVTDLVLRTKDGIRVQFTPRKQQ